MKVGLEVGKKYSVNPLQKMVGPSAPRNNRKFCGGVPVEYVLMVALAAFVLGALFTAYAPALLPMVQSEVSSRRSLNTSIAGDPLHLAALLQR
jgi:hypothetical protein